MRRREQPEDHDPSRPPLHLRRYDPADWPEPECHPECAFWAAIDQWREEHPSDFADAKCPLEVPAGPDVPWHPELI